MIPKIIHFCWLSGDDYPEKIRYCLNSWSKYLKGYEIRLWDLKRFNLDSSPWCKEAFEAKKYAFAADYIRCFALYHEGGIYLDSDVEVIKPFDDLLHLPYFIGKERNANLEPAIMGSEKGWPILKEMLNYYDRRHFKIGEKEYDMVTMPEVMDIIAKKFYSYKLINKAEDFSVDKDVMNIFEADFFSPKYSNNPHVPISKNTYCVHHFEASWYPISKKAYRKLSETFGEKFANVLSSIYKCIINR